MDAQPTEKIASFTQLNTWQESHKLVLQIYRITKLFPKDEIMGLTSQIRRAVVSVTSNIAEGFGRRSAKEKIRFYYISQGSLTELQNQLLIARDLNYLDSAIFSEIANQSVVCQKLLSGLIRSIQNKL